MTVHETKYAWEEWELTAYLLGELEPDRTAEIKSASENDPKLALQLQELERTLADVKLVLSRDGTGANDRLALAALYERVSGQAESSSQSLAAAKDGVAAGAVQPAAYAGYTWQRLVTRWENWASLAGLIMIAVLLYQRSGGQVSQMLALDKQRAESDRAIASTVGPAGKVDPAKEVTSGSELFGDTPIEIIEDIDLAIVKGAKRDVERTLDSIAQKNLSSAQPNGSALSPASGMSLGGMAGSGSSHGNSGNDPSAATHADAPAEFADLSLAAPSSPAVAAPTPFPAQPGNAPGAMPAKPSSSSIAANAAPYGMGSMGGMEGSEGGSAQMGMGGRRGASSAGTALGMGGMGGYGGMEGGGMMGGPAPAGVWPEASAPGARVDHLHPEPVGPDRLYRRPDPVSGDRYASFSDNEFLKVETEPLSTFSIDVDTASYSKARQYLLEQRQLPPPASVRIEEFINYFDYEYAGPKDDKPFEAALAVTECPWQPKHQLVRIALQAKQVERADRPKANLVFLLDVSGSMNEANKLPLVKETMRLLTYQLTENDKVAMVVYAGAAGCVLESTYGHQQDQILSAIERLNAGGSTNGGQGIQLAYKIARDNFISGGINRVILCTDGDFNVGVTNTNDLVEMVKEQAKSNVFLTVLGYGIGNTNDAMMEQIADRGNGLYGFVDSRREAQRQMVKQLAGNLMTVAKDVKIQVEFNPAKVRSYRLVGYENRVMAAEDFNNDKKDAGEIGAGHRVTAIYELVPVNEPATQSPPVDALRYQAAKRPEAVASVKLEDGSVNNELLAVKLRYKQPEGSESQLLTFPLEDKSVAYAEIDKDFRWAAAMAEFGMLLRNSPHKGSASWTKLSERARAALGNPVDTSRAETLEMINAASSLMQGR